MHFLTTPQRGRVSILFTGYGPLATNPFIACAYHFTCTTTNRRLLDVFSPPCAHSFVIEAGHGSVQTYSLMVVHK